MRLDLVRIDDRLIHGQVTCAWGSWLDPDRIILVNDEIAGTQWKRDLYAATDTLGSAISVLTRDQFVSCLKEREWARERVILIVGSPADMLGLIRAGLEIDCINVGGMHFSTGKRELLPYVFVDDDDVRALKAIAQLGVKLEARDVPQSHGVDLSPLLEGQ